MPTIPFGRLSELRTRPDADRIAYTVPAGIFQDYRWKVYASRAAMLAFAKAGSNHHALIKTPTRPGMIINRNTQIPE